jgi:hypothetical protein
MKRSLYLSGIVILIVFSCNDRYIKEDPASATLSNLKKIPVFDSVKVSSVNILSDSMSVVKIDSTVAIGSIDKLIADNAGCYILDKTSDNLLHINTRGNIVWDLNSVQSKGRLVKNKIKNFAIQGKQLFVMDEKYNLAKVDTGTGKPTKVNATLYNIKYKMVAGDFFVDSAGNFVICDHFKTGNSEPPYKIGVLDAKGKKVLGVHYVPPYEKSAWMSEAFPIHSFSENRGFYYADVLNDTIYAYQGAAFQRAYVVDFGSYKTPVSVVTASHTLAEFGNSKYAGNISQIVDLDGMLCFRFYWDQKFPVCFFDKKTNKAKTFFPFVFSADPLMFFPTVLCSYNGNIYFSIDPQQVIDSYTNLKNALYKTLDKEVYENILQKKHPLFFKLYQGLSNNSNPIIISAHISREKLFAHD